MRILALNVQWLCIICIFILRICKSKRNDALVSEQSILSKNHIYKSFYSIAMNPLVPILWDLRARGGTGQVAENYEQTHAHGTTTVTHAAHAHHVIHYVIKRLIKNLFHVRMPFSLLRRLFFVSCMKEVTQYYPYTILRRHMTLLNILFS